MSASGVPGAITAGSGTPSALARRHRASASPAPAEVPTMATSPGLVVLQQRLVARHHVVVGGGGTDGPAPCDSRSRRPRSPPKPAISTASSVPGLAGIVDEAAAVDRVDHLAPVRSGDRLGRDAERLDAAERGRLAGHSKFLPPGPAAWPHPWRRAWRPDRATRAASWGRRSSPAHDTARETCALNCGLMVVGTGMTRPGTVRGPATALSAPSTAERAEKSPAEHHGIVADGVSGLVATGADESAALARDTGMIEAAVPSSRAAYLRP